MGGSAQGVSPWSVRGLVGGWAGLEVSESGALGHVMQGQGLGLTLTFL